MASAYETNRYLLLRAVEGLRTKPYVDSAGIATIGVGYNIQIADHAAKIMEMLWGKVSDLPKTEQGVELAFRNQVSEVLGKTYGPSATKSLGTALAKVLEGRTLELANDEQAQQLFSDVAPAYEKSLKQKVGALTDDNQHLSLFSLEYNSGKLIGPGLKGALARGDHSEAWYEIRYGSNKDVVQAGRRYYESQIFGATDNDGQMDLDDARGLLVTRSRHIVEIKAYDATYQAKIQSANKNYSTGGNTLLVKIQKSDVVFNEAKNILIEKYGHGNALDEVIVDYANIKKGKLLISELNKLTTENYLIKKGALMLGGVGNDTITGSAKGDVLLGEGGDDTLRGGGGKDYLDGGMGNDVFQFNSPTDVAEGPDHIVNFETPGFTQAGKMDAIAINLKAFGVSDASKIQLMDTSTSGPISLPNNNPFIIYNQFSGTVSIDPDGNGPNKMVDLAILENKPFALSPSDFLYI